MTEAEVSVVPAHVAAAFGAAHPPERLACGRGLTWRSGPVVLRPTADAAEAGWKSEVLANLTGAAGFTVARPIRDGRGRWVCEGWQAMEWIPGAADEARVDDIVRAGEAFHQAVSRLERPPFIAASNDPWSRADRMAWGEAPLPRHRLLQRLAAQYHAVDTPAQVIHGDLLGNVLFAAGRPPAIIDWAPYWRPPGLGAAIAVVDAACWHGYPLTGLANSRGSEHWRQLLLRALVFRMATLHLLGAWNGAHAARHEPVAAAVLSLPD